jgi:hypothetical protein
MNNEIIKYAKGMNVQKDVFDWLEKRVFKD